jgi:gamma-glutamylcyclotransferase (GGCT)/AIG2-like uncharacterized protein YtfP
MMELLFVYGTLHEPDVQIRLIGRTVPSETDSLRGYERNFNLLPPYPVAMPAENSEIHGHILEIRAEELVIFDIYETQAYQRIRVNLQSGREAWVYIGNPEYFANKA